MGGAAGHCQPPLLSHARSAGSPPLQSGRIAQLVEQLTLNQRVPGSSPGAPTKQLPANKEQQEPKGKSCYLAKCPNNRNLAGALADG